MEEILYEKRKEKLLLFGPKKKRWKTVLYLWKFQGSMEQTEILVQSGIFSIHLCGETSVW